MSPAIVAGSLAAVLALALLAKLLGLGGATIANEAEALALAAGEPRFDPQEAWVAADGRGAIVIGKAGEVVLLKAHGAQVAARRAAHPLIAIAGDRLVVRSGDRRWGDLSLALADDRRAAAWTALNRAGAVADKGVSQAA